MVENKGTKIIRTIYQIVISEILFILGLILGLGIFSFIPACITVFEFIDCAQGKSEIARLNMINFFKTNMINNIKNYWKDSLIMVGVLLILSANINYLTFKTTSISYIMLLISVLLFLSIIKMIIVYSYICAIYPELNWKEKVNNTLALYIVKLPEFIICSIFFIACGLIMYQFLLGILIFTFLGMILVTNYWLISYLLAGHGFSNFKNYWRRED